MIPRHYHRRCHQRQWLGYGRSRTGLLVRLWLLIRRHLVCSGFGGGRGLLRLCLGVGGGLYVGRVARGVRLRLSRPGRWVFQCEGSMYQCEGYMF